MHKGVCCVGDRLTAQSQLRKLHRISSDDEWTRASSLNQPVCSVVSLQHCHKLNEAVKGVGLVEYENPKPIGCIANTCRPRTHQVSLPKPLTCRCKRCLGLDLLRLRIGLTSTQSGGKFKSSISGNHVHLSQIHSASPKGDFVTLVGCTHNYHRRNILIERCFSSPQPPRVLMDDF